MVNTLFKLGSGIYYFEQTSSGKLDLTCFNLWNLENPTSRITLPHTAVDNLLKLLDEYTKDIQEQLKGVITELNKFYEGLTQGAFDIVELEKLLGELDNIAEGDF